MTTLLHCPRHGRSPAAVVCVHLVEGSVPWASAVELDNGSEQSDYLCPGCDQLFPTVAEEDWQAVVNPLMRPVCMHCVRRLREGSDHAG